MTPVQVRALVAHLLANIAPEADLSTVGESQDLREAVDLDSMDFLNLIIGLSRESGVSIPEADYPRVFTLEGMATYLANH